MEYVVDIPFRVSLFKKYRKGDIISEAKYFSLKNEHRKKCSPIKSRKNNNHSSPKSNDSDIGYESYYEGHQRSWARPYDNDEFKGFDGGSGGGGGATGAWDDGSKFHIPTHDDGHQSHGHHESGYHSDHSSSYDSHSSSSYDSGSSDSGSSDCGGGGDGGGGGD